MRKRSAITQACKPRASPRLDAADRLGNSDPRSTDQSRPRPHALAARPSPVDPASTRTVSLSNACGRQAPHPSRFDSPAPPDAASSDPGRGGTRSPLAFAQGHHPATNARWSAPQRMCPGRSRDSPS
eukprot:scaffold1666_cov424-Prasinococcus_capsulatus_cf.AAC.4